MIRIIPRKTPDLPPVRLKAEGLDFFGDLERAEIRNHVASLRWTSRGGAATRWEYHFPGNSAGAMCDFGFTPPDSLGSTRNGVNFHPLSAPGTLGQPPLLTSVGFPLPPAGTILSWLPFSRLLLAYRSPRFWMGLSTTIRRLRAYRLKN
jgi:hypothetical protein